MKKLFLRTIILFAYVLGSVGGFGFSIQGGSWPCALSVVVLSVMALPTAWRIFREWIGEHVD